MSLIGECRKETDMIRNKAFIKRKIGTQYVIVAMGKAAKKFSGMISVNTTGSVIWELLEGDVTIDEIVAALTARYEIDEQTARADAIAFIDTLKGVGAIAD